MYCCFNCGAIYEDDEVTIVSVTEEKGQWYFIKSMVWYCPKCRGCED